MVPIAYASSEGSDEPAHPRKIASALTTHIHNEGACRGCEFKISDLVCTSMYPDLSTILSAPLILEQNIKHFVGQVLGPNCLLN